MTKIEKTGHRELDLGKWVGRTQAFGAVASRCSAAEAESMKKLRDMAAHKQLGLPWDDFCKNHLNMTRPTADRAIRHWEEFGARYFRLNEIVRVAPPEFRQIEAAVTDHEIRIGGETIVLDQGNAPRIKSALNALLAAAPKPEAKPEPVKADPAKERVAALNQAMERCKQLAEELLPTHLTAMQRTQVVQTLDFGSQGLLQLARNHAGSIR